MLQAEVTFYFGTKTYCEKENNFWFQEFCSKSTMLRDLLS